MKNVLRNLNISLNIIYNLNLSLQCPGARAGSQTPELGCVLVGGLSILFTPSSWTQPAVSFFPQGLFYKRETKLTWSQLTLKLWSWPEICLSEFVRGTEPWLVSRDSRHSWTSAIFLQILTRVWGDKTESILSQDSINRSQFTDPPYQ